MTDDLIDLLDGLELFREFNFGQLGTLAGYFALRDARRGEVIFNEGEPGDSMLVLIRGRIAVHKTGEHGRRLLSLEQPGRVLGEMALLDRERRSATCIAEDDCRMATLSQQALERLAAAHPLLAFRLMQAIARLLSRRLRRTSGVLAEHLID